MRGEQTPCLDASTTPSGSPPRARGAGRHAQRACVGVGITPRVRGEQLVRAYAKRVGAGSPPRARGAVRPAQPEQARPGITPACAGSSPQVIGQRLETGDHPRVRGEQPVDPTHDDLHRGSPPRARGADLVHRSARQRRRITPACAGSSTRIPVPATTAGDHPRVRGEQTLPLPYAGSRLGSPPRARGAAKQVGAAVIVDRITPACAGSRAELVVLNRSPRDHPRVRGEQVHTPGRGRSVLGSPPRARGAEVTRAPPSGSHGITPACAGSRCRPSTATRRRWDHPRVRGEQGEARVVDLREQGSPPRARGAGYLTACRRAFGGITPACAGSRPPGRWLSGPPGDHPRVRGEQEAADRDIDSPEGSPPRARGAAAQAGPRHG